MHNRHSRTSMVRLSNSVHIDTVVPGTATVLTTDELPGTIIVSVQAQASSVQNSPDTLCFHLSQEDARRLHRALTDCLNGKSH
jgi:hypothetical protein